MRDKIPIHESSGNLFADLGIENPDACLAESAKQIASGGREAWLHRNPDALAAVKAGLEQAAAGELVGGPNLESLS